MYGVVALVSYLVYVFVENDVVRLIVSGFVLVFLVLAVVAFTISILSFARRRRGFRAGKS